MKKSIEVKGKIKVDKSEMREIRAGTCAQYGVVCDKVYAKPKQLEMYEVATADELWLG